MVTNVRSSVRQASERDRQQLANLIHFESHIHRHLDWRGPLDWIGFSPYLVAEKEGKLQAALACPSDEPEIAWVRMFAVASELRLREAWDTLWPAAVDKLYEMKERSVAAIPLQGWLSELLKESDFSHVQTIVLMAWERGHRLPELKIPPSLTIRPMNYDDLSLVRLLDSDAFGWMWRSSITSLEMAFQQSAVSTVAEDEDGLVAYQISTSSPLGGHLARLAVLPRAQGQGIGYALVRDLIDQFERRGATRVTVNTQKDNYSSLALYEKSGFSYAGEEYPVFHFSLL